MKTKIYILLAVFLFASGCEQKFDEFERDPTELPDVLDTPPSAGNLDFSRFVAIGNSLTAGFQSGALFTEGQDNSIAAIMANQFAEVGGGDFNQPDINSENGYSGMDGMGNVFGRLLLQYIDEAETIPIPTPQSSNADAVPSSLNSAFLYSGDKSLLNNFAVPGIQVGQALIPETGDWTLEGIDDTPFNPFYARFASDPGTSTIIGDALARNPTFFFFWLGANDVLGYAVEGASTEAESIFTSETDFEIRYQSALGLLTANPEIEGVVGNIPYVASIPFFKLVPWNSIPLDATDASNLNNNANFQGLNMAVAAGNGLGLISDEEMSLRNLEWVEGQNGVLMIDEELYDLRNIDPNIPELYAKVRLANTTDLLPLTAGLILGVNLDPDDDATKQGVSYPVGDETVLTLSEQEIIIDRTDALNSIIKNVVDGINNASTSTRVALFDANQRLVGINAIPALIDDVMIEASLEPPFGIFSEDGVHPNSRGYALAAKWIIDAINNVFGSNVTSPNIAEYGSTGLPLPFMSN